MKHLRYKYCWQAKRKKLGLKIMRVYNSCRTHLLLIELDKPISREHEISKKLDQPSPTEQILIVLCLGNW